MRRWLRVFIAGTLAAAMLAGFGAGAAQAADRPAFVPGEVVVWAQPGVGEQAVRQAVAAANCDLVRATLMEGVYLARVKSSGPVSDQVTMDAVAALRQNPAFQWVGPNSIKYALDTTPNDPRYREQWHLPLMNMPQAWDIEKGSANVVVAVIDTGVDTTHPDLKDRLLPGYNSSGSGSTTDPTDTNGHGTHVSGIIAATTDNGVGVAGVTFQGVKILPIKAGDGGFTLTALVDALTFAEKQGAQVVNMSLGAATTSDTPPSQLPPDEAKIVQMAKNGVVFALAAGNSFDSGNPPFSPAYLAQLDDHILCVAACDKRKGHAYYSEARPYTTISAPGGDQTAATSDGVLSTYLMSAGGYAFEQGTSMAAPNAAGVVALLLSAGADASAIKNILTTTADTSMMTKVPDDRFGYGVVDAYKALLVGAVSVTVVEPDGTGGKASAGGIVRNPDPVETLRPVIRIAVSQITPDNLTVTLNGQVTTAWTVENVTKTAKNAAGDDVPVVYDAVLRDIDMPAGQNIVEVTGVKPGPPDRVVTDLRRFVIVPHQIPSGRSMVAFPYYQDGVTPETYLGTDFRLARWLPLEGRYAVYAPAIGTEPGASFAPPDIAPRPDGEAVPKYPLGIAYWADVESLKPVLTKGQPVASKPFVIPLRGRGGLGVPISWNMVGCPFPFDVPFNALLVDTPEGRISIGNAVSRGYLLPNIYSYDGANGYTFRTLPDGALKAWQGHWVGVTSVADVALVVPPVRVSRAAASTTADRSGWRLQIAVSGAGLNDASNFVGVAPGASDGKDLNDVPKPPMVSPYVVLGVKDAADSRGALLAQDLRAPGGQKTWTVMVSTDVPNTDLTLRWNSVGTWPRGMRITITDTATGQTVDMRTRASMVINSGPDAAPRELTITATPIGSAALRITNVTVRTGQSRASGAVQLDFTLSTAAHCDVKVLGADGRTVSTVTSRAGLSGDVHLVWNGKDVAGRSVPAGTYLMQIRAVTPDGEAVRVIQPFALVR